MDTSSTTRQEARHIVFALPGISLLAYHISTIEALIATGHKVTLISCRSRRTKNVGEETECMFARLDGLEAENANFKVIYEARHGIHIRSLDRQPNPWHLLRSYASYLRRAPDNFYTRRWYGFMSDRLQRVANRHRRVLPLPGVSWGLALAERLSRADQKVVDWLSKVKADVVIASPANTRASAEAEYLQAAKKIGIPAVVAVLSWDNLTTKGLIPFAPEAVFAWNAAHAAEAMAIHGIPRDQIIITGSPFFDKWFDDRHRALSRRELEAKLGIPAQTPMLLYLGSSKNTALNEAWLVKRLVEALSKHPDLSRTQVLVRPHPANDTMCQELQDLPQVSLLPSVVPFSNEATTMFKSVLRHAFAVVGINTSGFIDAIALDRPCYSIRTDRYTDTHLSAAHFRHLVQANAITIADDIDTLVAQLGAQFKGVDKCAAERRQFIKSFLRPRGPDQAAGTVAANAIIMLAQGMETQAINHALDSPQQAVTSTRPSPVLVRAAKV